MSHLVSHIFLLTFIILTIVYPYMRPSTMDQFIPGWYEWLLLIWLCGMLVSELRQRAKRSGFAWNRVFLLFFSAAAFFSHLLPDISPSCQDASHVLLSVAVTLGIIQLLEFLMFHHLFGPWAIIIRNLMKDLCRFTVILLLFLMAFSLSFSAVCQPVSSKTQNDSLNFVGKNASELQTPMNIPVLLFFTLFGLTDRKELTNIKPTESVLINLVFGIYLVVTVIVLLNLLIAMMSNTYQRIQDQSDIEWKFGRAILIRDISRKSESPPPFNLLTDLFFFVMSCCKHRGMTHLHIHITVKLMIGLTFFEVVYQRWSVGIAMALVFNVKWGACMYYFWEIHRKAMLSEEAGSSKDCGGSRRFARNPFSDQSSNHHLLFQRKPKNTDPLCG